MTNTSSTLRSAIGPGLLMAGAAIGVSHLVQSTRAGAEYGVGMAIIVILACVLKYPFIQFGPRYAAATGESLIAGYQRLGPWALGLFSLITIATMFFIQASVTIVTAGLAGMVFGLEQSITVLSAGVITACAVVLAVGHYRGLDLLMKLIMGALAVTTVAAVALAFGAGPESGALDPLASWDALWTATGIAFLLALLGWMPIPLDVAAWHSLWTLERAAQTGRRPSVAHAVIDCRIGYIAATVTAVLFLLLGALVMHGSGQTLPDSAVAFAGGLVDLYASSLGEWSRPLIAVAALTAMFSTTLAVTDAYPRVLRALIEQTGVADDEDPAPNLHRSRYISALLLVTIGALLVIRFSGERFTTLIDFTTTVSFLSAPLLAWLSLRLLTSRHMPAEHRPGRGLLFLARAGFGFLVAFSLLWLAWRLF